MDSRKLEKEVLQALQYINEGENFILEGGAGSGKTYSLIALIKELIAIKPESSIVCITYTNNAVAEIKSRIVNDSVHVSTIHEFIWNLINRFQYEIKKELINLINSSEYRQFSKPVNMQVGETTEEYFRNLKVEYDSFYSMTPDSEKHVRISHDHVLIIAEKLFGKYRKLCDILKDTANYIFVDEYQDTSPLVARILLEHLSNSRKENIIGFFGDSMQSIYDSGVGELSAYNIKKISKTQNRRNPVKIIELANKFRNDGILQVPSEDINAPNMEDGVNIEGNIKFLYGNGFHNWSELKNTNLFSTWNFDDGFKTKELRLTHAFNAEMAGFEELYELYNNDLIQKLIEKIRPNVNINTDYGEKTLEELAIIENPTYKNKNLVKSIEGNSIYNTIYGEIKKLKWCELYSRCKIKKESLFGYKFNASNGSYEADSSRDRILQRLDILNEIIDCYQKSRINDFFKKTKIIFEGQEDKITLKNTIEAILNERSLTIEAALLRAENSNLIRQDDLFDEFIHGRGFYLWQRLKEIPFITYRNSINYLKSYSPISTQHSVKGSEYDNVLLILESNWNKYNFEALFGKNTGNQNVLLRSKKLFYVCITRAKKSLVVYMPTDDPVIIRNAEKYFGKENVMSIFSIV